MSVDAGCTLDVSDVFTVYIFKAMDTHSLKASEISAL